MIMFILGILDIIAGVVLALSTYGLGTSLDIYFGIYELLKGLLFLRSLVSFLDIIAGAFLILASFGHYNAFTWIFALWLLQKGFFSFFHA